MLFKLPKRSAHAAHPVQIPRCEQLEDRLLLSLLGMAGEIGLPATAYDSGGTLTYDAATQSFDVSATPLAILGLGGIPVILPPNAFELHFSVDNAGNVVGGVAGDDLVISGMLDLDGNPGTGFEYSGVILTGEIVNMGYLDSGNTDQYDFRLTATGGALVTGATNYFLNKDIGLTLTSINSTFVDFTQSFSGQASGTAGPVELPVIPPPALAALSGFVYEDADNDGEIGANEYAIADVTVTLTGTDIDGNVVNLSQNTDSDGHYMFIDLAAGTYAITETQPAGYVDGIDTAGIGSIAGSVTGNDVFSNIVLDGVDGENYNFGEQANALSAGQTATIGFWQNKNGQNLLNSLNGDENSTALGEWLVATFPNIYGAGSTRNDLTQLSNLSNKNIADHYRDTFKTKAKELKQLGITNAPKLECQVMATAFAAYVTSFNLAGDAAAAYGFLVTANGAGASLFNIGDCGDLFGVADGTEMTIMDILLSTDSLVLDGDLYGLDAVLRVMANQVYTSINEGGDIA